MADESDSSDKTEDPTQKRLDEAHRRGDVAKSQEVNTWFVIAGATLVLPGPADAATTTGAVVGSQSGRCIDLPNASQTNGTQVQLYDCNNSANQTWTYTSSNQLQVYGNKCLDANGKGTSNGTAQYAITVTGSGTSWQVDNIQLSTTGQF